MLKAKYIYKYPAAPADRTSIKVSYDVMKSGSLAKLETVTEEVGVVKKVVGPQFVIEAEKEVEFYSSAAGEGVPRDGLVNARTFVR